MREARMVARCPAWLAAAAALSVASCHELFPFSPTARLDTHQRTIADDAKASGAADAPDAVRPSIAASPCAALNGSWTTQLLGPVMELNTRAHDETETSLQSDGLTIYFARLVSNWELWRASRSSTQEPFGQAAPHEAMMRRPYATLRFVVSADGLTGLLNADWPGGSGANDIWLAHRRPGDPTFREQLFQPLTEVNSPVDEYDPAITGDALQLYFVRGRGSGDSPQDLFFSTRPTTDAPFARPLPLPEVNSTADEDNPTITANGQLLIFSSVRSGSTDLLFATRQGDGFGEPTAVPGLNTAADETEAFISEVGCELFFSTDRDEGQYDIYRARLVAQ